MTSFGTEPIFGSPLAVWLIAAGLAALLALGPRFGKLTRWRWLTLTGLRLLVILLVTIALLRPTRITTVKTPRTSVLLLLFDVTRSMQLPSGTGEQTRWQAQKGMLEKAQSQLGVLAKNHELKVYAFDSRLHPVEHTGGKFPLPAKPEGESTDIGTPLHEATRAEQGKRVAAVIFASDGAQTAFAPQIEIQEAGRKLRDDFAAPLYTIPFGPAADAAQARDVAVERLDEQYTVFVKNELAVKGLVRIRGYVNKDIPVDLVLVDAKGVKKTIGSKLVRAEEDGRQVEVQFTYTPPEAGRFTLQLIAAQQEGELVAQNNQLPAYLTVLDGGLRVLYLDGEKRFEQKFLRRSLNASPDIELDDRIIDRRNRAGGSPQQPLDITDDLKRGRYDAFIIGDLDARLLTPASIQLLSEQIAAGKGLVMIGGRSSFGWGHYRGTPLEEALPVTLDTLEGTENLGEGEERFFLAGPVSMIPGEPHPLTKLASENENGAAWRKLPPLAWAHKFHGVKNSPGVRVLLEAETKEPLFVSGEFGRGRVLAFAGESTYLWTMHGQEREHKRFWRQVILWLVRRDDLDRDDVWIKLDQRRFNPGSRVKVTAGARTSAGDTIKDAKLDTTVTLPTGAKQPLKLTADKDGTFAGTLEVTLPGDYVLGATATSAGKPLGTARSEFHVFDRDIEWSNPAADPDQLAALAAWTKDDGGKLVLPEQVPALLDELAAKPQEFEERQTKWKLASTPTDAWAFLLLLVGLLTVEWWLRKRWGLV